MNDNEDDPLCPLCGGAHKSSAWAAMECLRLRATHVEHAPAPPETGNRAAFRAQEAPEKPF